MTTIRAFITSDAAWQLIYIGLATYYLDRAVSEGNASFHNTVNCLLVVLFIVLSDKKYDN